MPERRLAALDSFRCIADRCPANCCTAPWNISIDDATLEKWRALDDATVREGLLGAIDEAPCRVTGHSYSMHRDAAGRCVQLAANGLCTIHDRFGPELLPEVCRQFPRSRIDGYGEVLQTGSLACPEMARLVLFENVDAPAFRRSGSGAASMLPTLGQVQVSEYLAQLLDQVMANERTALSVELAYLSQVLGEMAQAAASGALSESFFEHRLRGCKQALYDLNLQAKRGKLRPTAELGGAFWAAAYKLAPDLLQAQGNEGAEAGALLAAMKQATVTGPGRAAARMALHERVLAVRQGLRPAIQRFDKALRRYVEVEFAFLGFPRRPFADNYIASFLHAALSFAVVQLFLWLRALNADGLEQSDVVDAVYMTERRLGHSLNILDAAEDNADLLHVERYYGCWSEVF